MELAAIITKLNKAAPGAVLQKARFGRGGAQAIWIEARALPAVAATLRNDPDLKLDWLENLSVAQLEDALVITYFLRSRETPLCAILRATVTLNENESPAELPEVPSVREIWPMARSMERESSELFGIRFGGELAAAGILPKGWRGFPLRKSYVFPQEVFGIAHSRQGTDHA
ncbi:MAG: NADH-quinone oxidoreductase subunit C [Oligoflexia bacterium]|nr:NADH-quinone oxidoreductase subunit C [Oligoflexia bacterium]